jgi:hypothetical protein
MRTFAIVSAIAAIAGLTSAQSIDPASIDLATRTQWCNAQKTSCPLLCLQYPGDSASTTSNTCEPKNLAFTCVCAVNGLSPNASEFSQTIPYFICTEWGNQCVKGCGQDNTCASNCRTTYKCGAQNPTLHNATTSSSATATATGSGSGSGSTSVNAADYTGFGGAAATGSPSKKNDASTMALNLGQSYGLGIVVTGVLAGFALML